MLWYPYVMLRCCVFPCTYASSSCYPAVCSHALIHKRHATLLSLLPCTCSHTSWGGVRWGGILMSLHLRCHALIHLRHARLLCFLLHLYIYISGRGGVGWCAFFITCYILLHYPVWITGRDFMYCVPFALCAYVNISEPETYMAVQTLHNTFFSYITTN